MIHPAAKASVWTSE